MRIGDRGNRTMAHGNSCKLTRHQHGAFYMNVCINKPWKNIIFNGMFLFRNRYNPIVFNVNFAFENAFVQYINNVALDGHKGVLVNLQF